jgi:hypothetical protein
VRVGLVGGAGGRPGGAVGGTVGGTEGRPLVLGMGRALVGQVVRGRF